MTDANDYADYHAHLQDKALEGKKLYRTLARLPFVYADGSTDRNKCFSKGERFVAVVDEDKRGDPMVGHPWYGKIEELDMSTIDWEQAKNLWWVTFTKTSGGMYLGMRE